jgi:hypothetical protein
VRACVHMRIQLCASDQASCAFTCVLVMQLVVLRGSFFHFHSIFRTDKRMEPDQLTGA